MKMTTDHLLANPCDEEEDNMAMLCCISAPNDMFVMSRYPDEDELDITRLLSSVAGEKIDEVFIGSCMTNIGHFRAAEIGRAHV